MLTLMLGTVILALTRCHAGEANRVLSPTASSSAGVQPLASNPGGPCCSGTLDTRISIQPKVEHK
jgi:hypothetical protein